MRKLKNWKIVLVLLLSVVTIQSCSKDDDASPASVKPLTTEEIESEKEFEKETGNAVTLYKVDGENIIKIKDYKVKEKNIKFQKDLNKHQEIWNLVKKIVPAHYRTKIKQFKIYAGIFDGKDEVTLGYVVSDGKDLSKWQMGIAIDAAYHNGFNYKNRLTHTIVHEFGHILTLDNTQLDNSVRKADCSNYFLGENIIGACSKTESYINKFENKYWQAIRSEFTKAQKTESEKKEFYKKYKTHFITEYAATSTSEDIAEVFSFFVAINKKPIDKLVKDLKIKSMYDYPELVKLRSHIRGNISKSSKSNYLLIAPRVMKVANRELKIRRCIGHK